jgi:putative ABC transport system permease protein
VDIECDANEMRLARRDRAALGWVMWRLALQNLGRRRERTLLLLLAVAICSGAVFTGAVLMQSIENSMDVGFTRLGADLLVVPEGTLTNITAALLTAEPTDLTLDENLLAPLAKLKGVGRIGPQLIYRSDTLGQTTDLIAFDPDRDITVQPWLEERLDRPLRNGDIIIGGRREEPLGSELLIFGKPHIVYGKLGKTAVGTHERSLFMTFQTFGALKGAIEQTEGAKTPPKADKLSGVLIELAAGATAKQAQFAILANFPTVKVVAGESMLSSVRQGLATLLNGALALMIIMFVSTASMIGVTFSAVITERRRELGLLKAIGAKRRQIIGLLLTEAAIATTGGGVLGCILGVLLMRSYQHSLVYYLAGMGVPFIWLSAPAIGAIAAVCILLASLIGVAGAFYPAWRASRLEPYDLIRSEE